MPRVSCLSMSIGVLFADEQILGKNQVPFSYALNQGMRIR
jgi:hypothetical protein